MNEQIFVMNADGTGLTRLTDAPAGQTRFDASPVWSSDGTEIASSRDGEIYFMNADGTGVTQVTNDGGEDPDWKL